MLEFRQLSEKDFMQWLNIQLERREYRIGESAEKKREILYEILFLEHGMTVEDIECNFIPYGQAGYLSARQKFELILFALNRDYGNSFLFLGGTEPHCIVTEEDINAIYLQWVQEERLCLSEEEKKFFFIQTILDKLGQDVLEVLKRVAPDGILLGEFCPIYYENEGLEGRIAVCSGGSIIRLPFLATKDKEEFVKVMKCFLATENRGELTIMEPVLDYVKEDGTCITAVRPPAGNNWGLRILYGAGKKGGMMWGM